MKKVKSKKFSLKVLNDRLLLKPLPVEKYQGNLVIPDAYIAFYENLPDKGTIVSIGSKCEGKWRIGQTVQFGKMAVYRMKYMGEDYLIIREYDIDISYD